MIPKIVSRVFDEFDKCNQKSPRMRAIDYQAFKQNSSDLLFNLLLIAFCKQIEQNTAEIMGVAVRIP